MIGREHGQRSEVRFVICDDDPMILEAFQEQLEAGRTLFGQGVQVRACCTSDEALALANEGSPDVVLIDLYICEERFAGIRILDTFATRYPDAKRIALTAHGSRLSENELRRLAACRLDGFLDKGMGVDRTLAACHRIWQGESIIVPHFASRLASLSEEQTPNTLSVRELEVLKLRARNEKIIDISRRLGISHSSVSTHLARIETKIGTKTPAGLRAWCRENGVDH